jgi:hypothetical protein
VTVPAPYQFTIGTALPATIYFTTDGSRPTLDGGAVKSAPSPVTIPTPSGVGPDGGALPLQYFADFGAAGDEQVVHTLTVQTAANPINLNSQAQRLKFTDSNGPVVMVAPGATVTGSIDYQAWASTAAGYCPGCVIQWVVGVDTVGQVGCQAVSGSYPGVSGTQTFSFTAPTKPGTYVMRQGLSLQFGCSTAGYPGGEDVGLVIVAP